MNNSATRRFAMLLIATMALGACLPAALAGRWIFSCAEDNDLFRVASENRMDPRRFDTPAAAVEAAVEGDGVLLLADGYPEKTQALDAALFAKAARKKLRVYLEYPSFLPGAALGAPRATRWERAVITSEAFAPALAKLRILAIHGCRFVPLAAENSHIVVGRVAGFDTAVYGPPRESFPILWALGILGLEYRRGLGRLVHRKRVDAKLDHRDPGPAAAPRLALGRDVEPSDQAALREASRGNAPGRGHGRRRLGTFRQRDDGVAPGRAEG